MKPYLSISASAYVALTLFAGLSGDPRLWGIYHLALFPGWLAVGLLIAALFLIWNPSPLMALAERLTGLVKTRRQTRIAMIGAMVLAALLFVIFRSKNHLLGDGYLVLSYVTNPEVVVPTELLEVMSHRLLYYAIGDSELSYLILSIASGILFLTVVWLFARRLTRHSGVRTATILCFLGLAQMQFFFGYAENYTVMTALVAMFLYLGWRNALDGGSLLYVSLAFIIAGLFHASAFFLLPSLLYLFHLRSRKPGQRFYAAIGLLILLLAIAAAVAYYTGYEGERIFTPIVATEMNQYTALSFSHLSDLANNLLLVAPLPLLMLAGMLFRADIRAKLLRPAALFFALSALGALLFTAAVDPKIGAVRDWDLLSLYGIPLTFLSVYLMLASTAGRDLSTALAGAGLAVILMHTAPWIASNTRTIAAKDMMKEVIAADVHYSPDYYKGSRLISWSSLLINEPYSDFHEGHRSCSLRVEGDPGDSERWVLYARMSYFLGKAGQAHSALGNVSFQTLPPAWMADLARTLLRFCEAKQAQRVLNSAIRQYPNHNQIQFYHNLVSKLESNPQEAMKSYKLTLEHSPSSAVLLNDGAALAICIGDYSFASALLRRAADQPDANPQERADTHCLGQILMQKLRAQPARTPSS